VAGKRKGILDSYDSLKETGTKNHIEALSRN
jgi:hypothetical protein